MSNQTDQPRGAWRERLRCFVEAELFQYAIIAVIVANAVVIGLETSEWAMSRFGTLLVALDTIALAIFVIEITLKLAVYRLTFFKSAWNVFDFVIVGIALVPAFEGLTVLRALRILRALRLLSMVPKMRMVVQGLLGAIPAMGSVLALLALVFYVFSVIATKLFGTRFPEWFGTIGDSLFSLFQVMTLESWSMGIVRPVMEVYPQAWAFFVPFILITTFAVLNLFIAIIVNSMHDAAGEDAKLEREAVDDLRREIAFLREEIAALRGSKKMTRHDWRVPQAGDDNQGDGAPNFQIGLGSDPLLPINVRFKAEADIRGPSRLSALPLESRNALV